MEEKFTGVILAGGSNTRLPGHNKAFIELAGQTTIDRLYCIFAKLFDEVIIVANQQELFINFDCLVATDLLPLRASLTGIHTGLFYARHEHIFVTGCDTPFLKAEVIKTVVRNHLSSAGASMPATCAGLEPLCAVYAKKFLPRVENHVKRNLMKIKRVFGKKRIHPVSEKKIRRADPELISFFNINYPEDLERAKKMATDHRI